jgi:hypothetical protein
MPQQIPPEVKADYLRALAAAGFTHIDAVSFVSPSAVPQMADSERVLALLDPDSAVEIIAIVPERSAPWVFPIPSPPPFLSVIKSRRSNRRGKRWRKYALRLRRLGWAWWPICPWPSVIPTATRGGRKT